MGQRISRILLYTVTVLCINSLFATSTNKIFFEQNRGQHPYPVSYVSNTGIFQAGFTSSGIHLYVRGDQGQIETRIIRFAGALPAELIPKGLRETKLSYYNGAGEENWYEDIPNYNQLTYAGIYPGIDITLYSTNDGHIEFDFIVAPGADPTQINFIIDEGQIPELTEEGDLLLDIGLTIEAPILYQETDGVRLPVTGDYTLQPDGSVGFDIGKYQEEKPLIIDPVLAYATYLGDGQGNERVADIAVDNSGNIYMTGTYSLSNQFYIAKIAPGENDFQMLLWYGTGQSDTHAHHIILDNEENIIVDVTTRDRGLPVKNAIQPNFGGIIDIYLIKHNPEGQRIFATYIGGRSEFPDITPLDLRGREYSSGIVVDANNNIFLSGETDGVGFPTTGNALHTSNIGNWDLFLMKFDPQGGLLYSSFIGGFENDRIDTGDDAEEAIAIDSSGNVYFTGYTENRLEVFPGSGNAFDNAFTGDDKHVLSVFDSKNNVFIYSTFLQGFEPAFLKIDRADRVHLAGSGALNQLVRPISENGHQFIAVMSPLTNTIHFSSYLPCEDCILEDVAVGSNNHLFFTAYDRGDPVFINDSLPEFSPAKRSAYVGEIDTDNAEMVFGMLVGGNENDNPEAIAISEDLQHLYLAGTTRSTDLPTTPDAVTSTYQGNGDVFLFVINLEPAKEKIFVFDANPEFIRTGFLGTGRVNNITDIDDPAELINAVTVQRDAIAADGVSEILLKFPFPEEVEDGSWEIDPSHGSIELPWGFGTQKVNAQHYFFALYRPPDAFPEGNESFKMDGLEATKASLDLKVDGSDGLEEFNFEITLVRPPVVLVHGTFDNPENCWRTPISPSANNMVQSLELAGFKVFTVDYTASNGKLDDTFFTQEALEASRFESNKRVVYENDGGIADAIEHFREELNIAATQAEVIGHSMGGILPRVFAAHDTYDSDYKRTDNFNEGDINRMISIASTHSGSELSDFLGFIKGDDDLLQSIPFIEKFINESVVFATYLFGGIGDTGAVQDQRPMSPALKRIGATDVPAHAIVCTVDDLEDLRANAGEPAFFATYFNFLRALTLIFYFNNATLNDFIVNLADRHHLLSPELKNANTKSSIFTPLPSAKVSDLRKPSNREEFIDMFNFPLNRFWFLWHLIMDDVVEDWFTTEEGVIVTQYETTEINYGDFDDNLQLAIQNEDWALLEGEYIEPFPSEVNQADQVVDFFRYLIFKNAANDCVVRYESQTAGLESSYFTEFNNHIHSYAPRYPEIINRCVLLLKSGLAPFSPDGFPPAGQDMPMEIPDPEGITDESMIDEETYTGCEAACWSGMVPSHAFVYAEVADILNMVILARPVNPDATAVIEADNATKPMKLKGKSSNWGPQRAFIAEDQRFSKLWFQYQADRFEERDDEIIKYNGEVVSSINDPDEFAELRHLIKPYTCAGNTTDYLVFFDSLASDPVRSIYLQAPDGQYYNWLKEQDDECPDKIDCCPLSGDPVFPSNLKPMNVLANPKLTDDSGNARFYTADYDLLAMATYAYSLDGLEDDPYTDAPAHDERYIPRFTSAEFDDQKGYITPEQNTVVDFINREVKFEANYQGGNVTHHGPENQYYIVDKPDKGSPYVDYPITAFEPDFSRFSNKGVVRSIPKGPPGFRDRYLKRYMAKMRRKGYNLYPNLIANGWQWDHYERYSFEKGWDDRDAPNLDSGPEEIPFPDNCDCNTEDAREQVQVKTTEKSNLDLPVNKVYPNPAMTVLKLNLLNGEQQQLTYGIRDIAGRLIRQHSLFVPQGLQTIQVNISDLLPGLYLFTISDENGRNSTIKFIKHSSN